jgi:hypothetical protein
MVFQRVSTDRWRDIRKDGIVPSAWPAWRRACLLAWTLTALSVICVPISDGQVVRTDALRPQSAPNSSFCLGHLHEARVHACATTCTAQHPYSCQGSASEEVALGRPAHFDLCCHLAMQQFLPQEVAGNVTARLVFRQLGLANSLRDPAISAVVLRGKS